MDFVRFKPLWALILFVLGTVSPHFAWSREAQSTSLGHRDGYLESVAEERHLRIQELMLIDKPAPLPGEIPQPMFTTRMSQEIRSRYQRLFGLTDAVQNIDSRPERFDDVEHANGVRVTQAQDRMRKQAFGDYVIRRVMEQRVDEFGKSNPSIAPAFNAKERLSNLDVAVKGGYKFNVNYSLAANEVHLRVDNPYKLFNRITFQMGGTAETTIYLNYPWTPQVWTALDMKMVEGTIAVVAGRNLKPGLATTLTAATYFHDNVMTRTYQRVILGLTWTH